MHSVDASVCSGSCGGVGGGYTTRSAGSLFPAAVGQMVDESVKHYLLDDFNR